MSICRICDKQFDPGIYHFEDYCSMDCWRLRNDVEHKESNKVRCKFCKSEFEARYHNQIYCSKDCQQKKLHGYIAHYYCRVCDQEFDPHYPSQEFCSLDCIARSIEFDLSEIDYAYLAGFLDADGSILSNGISLHQADMGFLRHFQSMIGFGNIYNGNNCLLLKFDVIESVVFITKILPYLRIKKDQATCFLTLRDLVFFSGRGAAMSNKDRYRRDMLQGRLSHLKTQYYKYYSFEDSVVTKTDYAYLAGFIDGDGFFSISGSSFMLGVCQSDYNFLRMLNDLFGNMGNIRQGSTERLRTPYELIISGTNTSGVLSLIYPYLIKKKRHCKVAKMFIETIDGSLVTERRNQKREILEKEMKHLNNTFFDSSMQKASDLDYLNKEYYFDRLYNKDLAYLAGVFDAGGTCYIGDTSRYVQFYKSSFGKSFTDYLENNLQCPSQLYGNRGIPLLKAVYPYLLSTKAQANQYIEYDYTFNKEYRGIRGVPNHILKERDEIKSQQVLRPNDYCLFENEDITKSYLAGFIDGIANIAIRRDHGRLYFGFQIRHSDKALLATICEYLDIDNKITMSGNSFSVLATNQRAVNALSIVHPFLCRYCILVDLGKAFVKTVHSDQSLTSGEKFYREQVLGIINFVKENL